MTQRKPFRVHESQLWRDGHTEHGPIQPAHQKSGRLIWTLFWIERARLFGGDNKTRRWRRRRQMLTRHTLHRTLPILALSLRHIWPPGRGERKKMGEGEKLTMLQREKTNTDGKTHCFFLYQLLIHHLWLVCPFLTVYSTTKSTLNIVASSFHRIKQSKSQRYFHVICNSLLCKHSHLRH